MVHQNERIIYVIPQCIPIPITLKTTNSRSLIIPISIDQREPIKNLYKHINKYFQETFDKRGLEAWKNSSKLIMSEYNHQLYQCTDEQIFEQLYTKPYDLLQMIQEKKLNFQGETYEITPSMGPGDDM